MLSVRRGAQDLLRACLENVCLPKLQLRRARSRASGSRHKLPFLSGFGSGLVRSFVISEFSTNADDARADQGLVADGAQREADQNRRGGRQPRVLCGV
jgi:hypothetical protein